MRYRVYRLTGTLEYKDVEADNEKAALAHDADPESPEYRPVNNGLILFACVTQNLNQELKYSDLIENVLVIPKESQNVKKD